ncbi:MAG: hypothetical protein WCA10_00250 [Terracidiphilus sp.]
MKIAAVAFVLLLSSFPLAAQNGAKPEGQVLVLRSSPVGNGCPIGMIANQGVWDHTIRVRQGQQETVLQPFGQRIFLTLNDSHPAPIVAATVKVYGLTARNHMVQANGNANPNGDATKIIEVKFVASQKGGVTGDLYIPGFTAVNSIELLQVSYDDGRVWRIGGSSVCRVAPDPMMLIANH